MFRIYGSNSDDYKWPDSIYVDRNIVSLTADHGDVFDQESTHIVPRGDVECSKITVDLYLYIVLNLAFTHLH